MNMIIMEVGACAARRPKSAHSFFSRPFTYTRHFEIAAARERHGRRFLFFIFISSNFGEVVTCSPAGSLLDRDKLFT